MTVTELYKSTAAYRMMRGDADRQAVGHAYLLVLGDKDELRGVLKLLAKALLTAEDGAVAGRIDRETYSDCVMVPAERRAVSVEDVDDLVADSVLRPMEGDKKLYVIEAGSQMSAQAQNKLLKTLEEPPKGVHLLIGVTTDSFLLSTVKSRVRRLEIPPFSPEQLFQALIGECPDAQKLRIAAAQAGGSVSRCRAAYESDAFQAVIALALDVLTEMKTSRDVARFAARIADIGNAADFYQTLKLLLRDVLCYLCDRPLLFEGEKDRIAHAAETFTEGAAISAIQKINEAEYAAAYNANAVMQTDSVLFAILEGKYTWRKS